MRFWEILDNLILGDPAFPEKAILGIPNWENLIKKNWGKMEDASFEIELGLGPQ